MMSSAGSGRACRRCNFRTIRARPRLRRSRRTRYPDGHALRVVGPAAGRAALVGHEPVCRCTGVAVLAGGARGPEAPAREPDGLLPGADRAATAADDAQLLSR